MKKWLIFLLVSFLFYGTSLSFGFSQDDFFHLKISAASDLSDIANFFNPAASDWVFFRPLSTQFWYFIFRSVFGWQNSPAVMHLIALFIHSLNALLVSLLMKEVFKIKDKWSIAAGILYAASGVHFLSLFYIGATQQILATFFTLLAALAHIRCWKGREIFFLILALLSKEIAFRYLPFIFIIDLIRGKKVLEIVKSLLVPGAVFFTYILLRFLTGFHASSEYTMSFGVLTTVATIMWYFLMTLGAPEYILHYGLSAGKIDFVSYISDFPLLGTLNLFSIVLLAIILISGFRFKKSIWYFLLWLSALLPVLFLPSHRYSHYLDISLIALLVWMLDGRHSVWRKYFAAAAFILASITSLAIDRQTHWTIKRAEQALRYTKIIQDSGTCSGGQIIFHGDPTKLKELSYSLMLENGPQIICGNPHLQVYYQADVVDNTTGVPVIEVR